MFITGKPVYGKQFIDRKKHLPLFQTFIEKSSIFYDKSSKKIWKDINGRRNHSKRGRKRLFK